MSSDLRTRPIECRCMCHRTDSVAHFAPCCCRHRYKRNCPECAALRNATETPDPQPETEERADV